MFIVLFYGQLARTNHPPRQHLVLRYCCHNPKSTHHSKRFYRLKLSHYLPPPYSTIIVDIKSISTLLILILILISLPILIQIPIPIPIPISKMKTTSNMKRTSKMKTISKMKMTTKMKTTSKMETTSKMKTTLKMRMTSNMKMTLKIGPPLQFFFWPPSHLLKKLPGIFLDDFSP